MLEFIKEHKMILITVVYAAISLYILFSQTPKSFEKYSLVTNTLLLIGLFIMVAYQAVPSSNLYVGIIFTTLIVSAILFYIFPMLSESLTLLFNLSLLGVGIFLIYKYIIKNLLSTKISPIQFNLPKTDNISIGIFILSIATPIIYWLYNKANRKIEGGGKIVIHEPVHLNSLRSISDYKELNGISNDNEQHNYHYSVSFWAFLHSQPNKGGYNKYNPIFNYGEKPLVEYNSSTQTVRVRVEKETIYEGKIIPQKWTNFVITYDGGIVDVFIDTNLVATRKGVVPFMTYDIMTVGENNGVSGGIGYLRYYTNPVNKSTIDYNYNKFKSLIGKTFF